MPEGSMMTGLAPRLRAVRKRRGLSQRELAKVSGVSFSLISKLEQGVVEGTRLETVRKLAVAMRMSTTDLLGNVGDAEEPTDSAGPEHVGADQAGVARPDGPARRRSPPWRGSGTAWPS